MARKSQSPKRARAQATASDASQQPDNDNEADAEETTRPRGRGRPRKSLDSNPETTDSPDAQRPKRARGRPSMGIMAAKAAAAAEQPKRKRGRPSLGGEKKTQSPRVAASSERGDEPSSASKRGRPRKEVDQGAEEDDYVDHPQPAKRKRGRPSLKDQLPTEAANETSSALGGKKRGRKPLKDRTSWGEKRQRSSEGPEQEEEAEEEQEEEEEDDNDDDAPDDEEEGQDEEQQDNRRQTREPRKPYPHVVPRVRGVKQATIDAKWNPLTASSIAAATETLTLAHRPIMQRLANTQQRRQHTASALSLLHRRVSRKLKRGLPFPPPAVAATTANSRKQTKGGRRAGGGGHEAELDFESVLDGAQALERQLDPAIHSLELLKKEKERMEQELEKDYQTLQHLEAGARMQAREQRDQLKKTHALVPDGLSLPKDKEQEVEMKFEHKGAVAPGIIFKDLEDGELKDLALQLGGHVDSMRTNLKQTDGLVPQMAKSRAALRSVLFRHLSQEQYDEVVLGQ